MSAAVSAGADLAQKVRARVLERGIATAEEVARAEREASERGQTLAAALVATGIATEDQMGHIEAEELGVPYVFPYAGSLDLDLLGAFPADLLRRLEAIPVVREPDHVVVALPAPPSGAALGDLEAAAGSPVRFSLASRRRLLTVLAEVLGPEPSRPAEPPAERIADPAAVALLYGHLARAIAARASEVRFEPVDGAISVRYRVEGRLAEVGRERLASLPALVSRARVMSGAAAGGAAPGHFARAHRTSIAGREVTIEVRLLPTRAGESILLRLDAEGGPAASLERAGLSPAAEAAVREVAALERGLVLVSSWDARAAVAAAYMIGRAGDPARRAVIAVEREALEPEPRFRQVALGDGPLEGALAAAIGHGPDVLIVGEPVEDGRSAAALLRAAETALVVAVGADPDGPEAIVTWLEMGARPTLLARALRAVVSPAPAAAGAAGADGAGASLAVEVVRAAGALREAIARGAPPFEIRAACEQRGAG